jgi:hypothetical protein
LASVRLESIKGFVKSVDITTEGLSVESLLDKSVALSSILLFPSARVPVEISKSPFTFETELVLLSFI